MPEFGTGPDTLTLHMTADQFDGAPHFNFYVLRDGLWYEGNLAEYQPVTAERGSAGDTYTFRGDWQGANAFGITFVDDAYAGPGQDRNIYLDSAEINGVPIDGAKLIIHSNGEYGPIAFDGDAAVTPPPPPPAPEPVTLRGTTAADTLAGGGADDRLSGLGGNDDLSGLVGDDYLAGGTGTDRLDGGAGDDWLFGGTSADTLTGGAGADTFVFGDISHGVDVITDFNAADGDKLDMHALLGAFGGSTADLVSGGFVRVTAVGADTRVAVDEDGGGNTFTNIATLQGVAPAALTGDWLVV